MLDRLSRDGFPEIARRVSLWVPHPWVNQIVGAPFVGCPFVGAHPWVPHFSPLLREVGILTPGQAITCGCRVS